MLRPLLCAALLAAAPLLADPRDKLGVARWHAAGLKGAGVKVCVLDNDFAGYKADLGTALPAKVISRSFRFDGDLEAPGCGHGRRAAQVVHTLAPAAELLLVNFEPTSPDSFVQAVRWAKQQGAKVVTCSVTVAAWSDGDGGGPVHRKLRQAVGDDVLFVCAAGNHALGHWGGSFAAGPGGMHLWSEGVVDHALMPCGDSRVTLSLIHKPGCVYELLAFEGDSAEPIARRTSEPGGELVGPCLCISPRAGRRYRVRVRLVSGKGGHFHLVARDARLGRTTPGGVCCFPADGAFVLPIGACDAAGRRADYSARGKGKPPLTAPVPFPLPGCEADFDGTSAAAPQAAALLALLAGRHPDWSAKKLRDALLSSARPAREGGDARIYLPPPK